MKPSCSNKSCRAFTLSEVFATIVIVIFLAAVALPFFARQGHRGGYNRINCLNNLKQVGLAYRLWASDNNDKYPMGVSVANGGSMELVATGNVTQTYLILSNELSTPKVLLCPEDRAHVFTASFAGFANSNISYFVGVDATNQMNPELIISGDAHFQIGSTAVKSGLAQWATSASVGWTADSHIERKQIFGFTVRGPAIGNIGKADGSVQSVTAAGLEAALRKTGLATNRFAIP